ncbi:MAG: PTS lactose/cellobiose transporter subunit IIA [Atopobiaceae bacterium]|nr:PTS lactose/cellobiose transporter subunit IIA [Atopobiaceae bacterium]MCH4180985.1 PTS lactose/cellobiose transporter subunit IIA [Atopobiaceae bacterium]MCH4229350.1 PTS lactose/cellobiose transporter subunit IIA [Atopobiaceae bacterium]MCH4276692.1 PTS lactose/cellobiose transporter subunit IIA [Atopobiaceae bacterium]MCI1226398.1 PTS lactose/cellobiose transporter subunit IIA [Atopobiaceae bacterium]
MTKEEQEALEESQMTSFGIIAAAGDARSKSYAALAAAKEGDFDKADELLGEAEKSDLQAHDAQTQLLVKEANGDHTPVDVMLVHAQDHLMCAMLARELVTEMVGLYKRLAEPRS